MEEKENYYASLIIGKIVELFDEDEEDHSISLRELSEGGNATHFIHALANLAPNFIYQKVTGDDKNMLEFNHMANHLCFQYSQIEQSKSKKK